MRYGRFFGVPFVVVIGMLLCVPQFLAAGSLEEATSARLVEIGLHIEQQIRLAQYNLECGTLNQDVLTRQAQEAATALEGLEGQIQELPDETRDILLFKLESVKSQANNLTLAARLGSAPPRHIEEDSRIKHFARNGRTQSVPANDECEAAFEVGFGSFAGDTTDANNDGDAVCGSSLDSPDVWYRFVAPASGAVEIDTAGSLFDTVLSVHSGCPGTMSNQIVCNDDALGLQSAVSFAAHSGYEYLIRVSGVNGATGYFEITVSEGGSINGKVTETGTGLPIQTRVTAVDARGYQCGQDYTDYVGDYTVSGLIPGAYFVVADGFPYALSEVFDNIPCPGGMIYGCDFTAGDLIPVAIGEVTDGIDFVLDSGGEIIGVVKSETTGEPLSGVLVSLFDGSGKDLRRGHTDSLGGFSFSNLEEGGYYIEATSSSYRDELYENIPCPGGIGYGCSLTEGTVVEAASNDTTSGIDFNLVKLGAIRGTVIDRGTALPISSANVNVFDSQGTYFDSAYTDTTGAYEIGGIEDGTYYVQSSKSSYYVRQAYDGIDCPASSCAGLTQTPVVIADHSIVAGIDFDLVKKGIITGHVIDSETSMPIQGVRVRAYDVSGSAVFDGSSNSTGEFVFDGLDAGTYFVAIDDYRYFNEVYDDILCLDLCDPTSGTPVESLNGQTTAGIDFSVAPKGKITGSVTAEDGGQGAPMNVRLYDSFGNYLRGDDSYQGVYEFSGLDDGQYFVVADSYSSAYSYLEELYDDIRCWGGPPEGCVVTEGTPVTVVAPEVTSGIDFLLKRKGKISGIVRDAVDDTLLSGKVYVKEVAGSGVWSSSFNRGVYIVKNLSPGDYLVIVDADFHVDEVWRDIPCAGEYPDFCDLTGAIPVTVPTDTDVKIDFSLERLASVNGSVRSAVDGSPLAGYYVRAFNSEGIVVASDLTDSDGEYTFGGIWPATIFVSTTENSPDYVDQLYNHIECPQGPPQGCELTNGTPLVVGFNSSVDGIDFNLGQAGSISGRVIAGDTSLPMYGIQVGLWDSQGNFLRYDSTDYQGLFDFRGLGGGTFFVATDEFISYGSYLDMLYDEIPCPTGPPDGCDPSKGTPVLVVPGTTTRFIDFALVRRTSGISGMVLDALTGDAISGVYIDLWNSDSGVFQFSVFTSAAGTYIASVDPGNFVVATDNSGLWVNQIWDGIECPGGSPFNGDCDPMAGAVITFEQNEQVPNIDFFLKRVNLFSDGFESGDTILWSTIEP